MRLDIFRRTEAGGHFSYLAVPEGQYIPHEVENVDWESTATGVEFDESKGSLPDYAIEHAVEQINAKGYAITAVDHQP